MTPNAAARLTKHARRLLTNRILTPTDYAIADCLLWRVRPPGRADMAVTYSVLARLCGIPRGAAMRAVAKLVSLGLIAKTKRRVRVAWGRGLTASRQIANAYRWIHTESGSEPTESRSSETLKQNAPTSSALEGALARFAAAGVFRVPD